MLLLHEAEKCASPFHPHGVYLRAKITPKQIFENVIMEELSFWRILLFTLAFALLQLGLKPNIFVNAAKLFSHL